MNLLNYLRNKNELVARLRRQTATILRLDIVHANAMLREQVRLLNRAVQRRNRTIERMRARLTTEQPTNLPELAKTKEGRALYNHAYNKGRIRGRRDVLDAMVKGASTGNPALDEAMEDKVTSAAYGQEHAH